MLTSLLNMAIPPEFQFWATPTQTTHKVAPSKLQSIKKQTRNGKQKQ